jgi:hypothetical protein
LHLCAGDGGTCRICDGAIDGTTEGLRAGESAGENSSNYRCLSEGDEERTMTPQHN